MITEKSVNKRKYLWQVKYERFPKYRELMLILISRFKINDIQGDPMKTKHTLFHIYRHFKKNLGAVNFCFKGETLYHVNRPSRGESHPLKL